MTRIWRCDNCGKEYDNPMELYRLRATSKFYRTEELGDFCHKCVEKIRLRLKEGIAT